MPANKILIISDIHLSDGSGKYSSFKDDSKLKGFLKDVAGRNDVGELVLLGDVLDLWMYPIATMPFTASQVITHWSGYDSVISALRLCADKLPNVIYINGNHDMGVTKDDLALISPKIKFFTADQYNQKHPNGPYLEHGHLVDIFNAPPESADDPIQGLPLGYFITRLAATAQNHEELWTYLAEEIKGYFNKLFFLPGLKQRKMSQDVIPASFDADKQRSILDIGITFLVKELGEGFVDFIINTMMTSAQVYYHDINESSAIIMPDGSSITISEVKKHYHPLLFNWYTKMSGKDWYEKISRLYRSALASYNLDWYAKELLQAGPAKVLVMGHTHTGKSMSQSNGLYANSGCWVTGKNSTYMEVDLTASPKAVVKTYPGHTVMASYRASAAPAISLGLGQKKISAFPMDAPELRADETAAAIEATTETTWVDEPLPKFWKGSADLPQ